MFPDIQTSRPTIAMNARNFASANTRNIMASRPIASIARKARSKAEADFAIWLMMAKLGSFDELPSNAQSFLTNYRARLDRMSESESKVLAVHEVYNAYYSEMGGPGDAPELEVRNAASDDKVLKIQRPRKPQPATSATGTSAGLSARKSVPALLIFAGMVVLIAAYRFLTHCAPGPRISGSAAQFARCDTPLRRFTRGSQDARREAHNATRLLRICSTSEAHRACVVALKQRSHHGPRHDRASDQDVAD
jgi:hypothetical protein